MSTAVMSELEPSRDLEDKSNGICACPNNAASKPARRVLDSEEGSGEREGGGGGGWTVFWQTLPP